MKTFIKNIYNIKILLFILCFPAVFAGCGKNFVPTENNNSRLSIVTTIFPYYDFTRQVAGDKADI
ncbi:MAG: zinc ABC transporter substrate-binding protein, partial [Lachnospiraceae bacterium]